MPKTEATLLKRAKAMQSEMTQPERELWTALRARRLAGVKFSRQVVVGAYIVDFVARSVKLAIELDGDSHADNEVYDRRRTEFLAGQGYNVLRFANADVSTNLEAVLSSIAQALATAPLPTLSPEGRGLIS